MGIVGWIFEAVLELFGETVVNSLVHQFGCRRIVFFVALALVVAALLLIIANR